MGLRMASRSSARPPAGQQHELEFFGHQLGGIWCSVTEAHVAASQDVLPGPSRKVCGERRPWAAVDTGQGPWAMEQRAPSNAYCRTAGVADARPWSSRQHSCSRTELIDALRGPAETTLALLVRERCAGMCAGWCSSRGSAGTRRRSRLMHLVRLRPRVVKTIGGGTVPPPSRGFTRRVSSVPPRGPPNVPS